MMDKDKLRKADIFSGSIIMLFGLWIISQALQMPMKDSWGGVQNVWYVSPALLPPVRGGHDCACWALFSSAQGLENRGAPGADGYPALAGQFRTWSTISRRRPCFDFMP
jgi:hypothetical protein